MRKIYKSLFMMLLITILVVAYPGAVVNAAETPDYSSYVELKDESVGTNTVKQNDTNNGTEKSSNATSNTNQSSTATPTTNTTTTSTTSNKPHQTAGEFVSLGYVAVYAVVTTLTVVGYVQYKKYNY